MIYRNAPYGNTEHSSEHRRPADPFLAKDTNHEAKITRTDFCVGLAPMAGSTGVTFRSVCRKFKSSFGCTELVSARGIAYQGSVTRSYRYLQIDPAVEGPCAIQLFGHEAADFAKAVPIILSHPVLSGATWIDLNMGCPVSKVIKNGAGAALMRDLCGASSIIRETVRAAEPFGVPVTVKFRKGWDEEHSNAVEFARMCRDSGASMITLHARTRDQMYHGKADWVIIKETTQALRGSGVKVIGNGDVKDGESAKRMFDETGVDGIAVGRASLGNPWVFSEISDYLEGKSKRNPPSPSERKVVIFEHLDGLIEQLGEERGVKEMRAQLAFYLKGQYGAADFRAAAVRAREASEVREIVTKWAETARRDL